MKRPELPPLLLVFAVNALLMLLELLLSLLLPLSSSGNATWSGSSVRVVSPASASTVDAITLGLRYFLIVDIVCFTLGRQNETKSCVVAENVHALISRRDVMCGEGVISPFGVFDDYTI